MEGYLNLRINPMIRRLITRMLAIVPAFICILYFGEERIDRLLILSQVVLSVQLGFAVIPLIHFVSDKQTMGDFVIKWPTKVLAWLIAVVLVYLNARMVVNEIGTAFTSHLNIFWLILIVVAAILFVALFILMTILPLIKKQKKIETARMHMNAAVLQKFRIPELKCIAVALDFSKNDENLIANALSQGNNGTRFLLLHIVESPSARVFGEASDDFETRKDRLHLESYVEQLQTKGFAVEGKLGYKHRVKEIVRLVKEADADMLVMGAHNHSGIMDYLYGETVDKVRHQLRIPVLIVS
jgi:manganese transport protein